MNVYDEYIKTQSGPAGDERPQPNGENLQPNVEEVKDAEA